MISAGAANRVIAFVTRSTLKRSGLRAPTARPLPAMMAATSARGAIPTPMRSAPSRLNPKPSAELSEKEFI